MPTYSIDAENNLAMHPDKDAASKEAGATVPHLARMSNSAPMSFNSTVGTGSRPGC